MNKKNPGGRARKEGVTSPEQEEHDHSVESSVCFEQLEEWVRERIQWYVEELLEDVPTATILGGKDQLLDAQTTMTAIKTAPFRTRPAHPEEGSCWRGFGRFFVLKDLQLHGYK